MAGRKRKYESAAERQKAYRERNNLVPLNVSLTAETAKGLEDYLKFKDKTKAEVIEKLIKTQLLRKR